MVRFKNRISEQKCTIKSKYTNLVQEEKTLHNKL